MLQGEASPRKEEGSAAAEITKRSDRVGKGSARWEREDEGRGERERRDWTVDDLISRS